MTYKKPELLAPAGDMEAFTAAVNYGADAVYIGGKAFSMRASPQNFTDGQIAQAAEIAHQKGKKLYLACNTVPRNEEIEQLPNYFGRMQQAGVDALIVSDLGVLALARRYAPTVDIHISTQAGIVNYAAASALYEAGARRVVLARELSLKEIAELRRRTPEGLEIEAFVHGSMCVSFSGRCLLSNYLAARDGNRGECAQSCRWRYALSEEKRPGQYFPVFEDERGTYVLNARDLCMLGHLPELLAAGVGSFKIEGRAKSAYYVAAVTNAYRLAIDAYFELEGQAPLDPRLLEEVKTVSHRDYCTGFYFGPIQQGQDYGGEYDRGWDVVAVSEGQSGPLSLCRQRNAFSATDQLEMLRPGEPGTSITIEGLYDDAMNPLMQVTHPDMRFLLKASAPVPHGAFLRRKRVKP